VPKRYARTDTGVCLRVAQIGSWGCLEPFWRARPAGRQGAATGALRGLIMADTSSTLAKCSTRLPTACIAPRSFA